MKSWSSAFAGQGFATPRARAPDGPSADHGGDAPVSGRMQPLESVDFRSRAVTKRAARGHADLVEQVVGLRTLAAAHLAADGDERVPLQPGEVESRLVLPRGTSHSAVSWVEGGGATVTRVRARDGPDIEKDVEKMLEQDHVRALPECNMWLETFLPHERRAIRASMCQT